MTDETPTLEQRVAALEAAAQPPQITLNGPFWELSPEEMDRLRADIEKAVKQPPRIVSPSPLEQRVTGLEAALSSLMSTLVRRGDISLNDARTAHGLKPFEHLDGDVPCP